MMMMMIMMKKRKSYDDDDDDDDNERLPTIRPFDLVRLNIAKKKQNGQKNQLKTPHLFLLIDNGVHHDNWWS